jgi:hypothetical protein
MKKILPILALCLITSNVHTMATKVRPLAERWKDITILARQATRSTREIARLKKAQIREWATLPKYKRQTQMLADYLALEKTYLRIDLKMLRDALKTEAELSGLTRISDKLTKVAPLAAGSAYVAGLGYGTKSLLENLTLASKVLDEEMKKNKPAENSALKSVAQTLESVNREAKKLSDEEIEGMPDLTQEELNMLGID